MEIDEKNLSKHIGTIATMDNLKNLTLVQAREVAMLMEHERLKATEECTASKKKSLVVDHAIKIDLSAVSEIVRKEIDEAVKKVFEAENDTRQIRW